MQQGRGDRRVHAAGERAEHPSLGRERTQALDRRVDEGRGRPVRLHLADLKEEVREHFGATLRMHHLGMELYAEEPMGGIAKGLDRSVGAPREQRPAVGQALHAVPVRHPDGRLLAGGEAVEQVARIEHRDRGPSVLAAIGLADVGPGFAVQNAHAVTDAEDRDAEFEDPRGEFRRAGHVDARRTAGEDDPRGLAIGDGLDRGRAWEDLAVHAGLAHAARDQLRVLASEVEDDDHASIAPRRVPGRRSRDRRSPDPSAASLHAVVGRLLRHDDVVDMALAQARGGHADEARVLLHGGDRGATRVAHRGLHHLRMVFAIHRERMQ